MLLTNRGGLINFKNLFLWFMLTFFSCSSFSFSEGGDDREIALAEKAIFYSMIRLADKKFGEFCSGKSAGCIGVDQTELALALMGNKKKSVSRFARLIKYGFDGAASESYQCYSLRFGSEISAAWSRMSLKLLRSQCVKEVMGLMEKQGFDEIRVEYVCASVEDMNYRRESLTSAIRRGRVCGEDDF